MSQPASKQPDAQVQATEPQNAAARHEFFGAISFEFFPPKSDEGEAILWRTISRLERFHPRFVSVTYGAGGSTRERTHRTLARIRAQTRLEPAAHLTCVGASRDEIGRIARQYWRAGIRHIVALRGDPPEGTGQSFAPDAKGYAHATELTAGLMDIAPFEISVACYPECHPESPSLAHDIHVLKAKQDAGARRAISQFFFEADVMLRFRDRAAKAGILMPIIPGIMLQPNFKGLSRMAALTGAHMPSRIADLFAGLDNEPETRMALAASLAAELTSKLRDEGFREFHFYTLNRSELADALCRVLGIQPDLDADPLSPDPVETTP